MIITKFILSASGNEINFLTDEGNYNVSRSDFFKIFKISNSDIPEDRDEFFGGIETPFYASEDERKSILSACEKLKAVKYASYLLSIGDKSERKLYFKLRSKFDEDSSQKAIELLKKQSLVCDEKLCARKLEIMANEKLYGPARLKNELYAKGFNLDVIEKTLEKTEVDFEENLEKLFGKVVKRIVPENREQLKKISDKLLRYGYSYDDIRNVIENSGIYDNLHDNF